MISFLSSLLMGFKEESFKEAMLYTTSILFYVIVFCQYMGYDWMPFVKEFRVMVALFCVKGVMDYRERINKIL